MMQSDSIDCTPAMAAAVPCEVSNSDGMAMSGAAVNLTLTVVEADDGHPAGQHTASHIATLTPTAGATGADGRLNFTFTAPAAGGTHTITATCNNCSNTATGTIVVPVDQYTLTLDTPAGDIEPSGTAASNVTTAKAMSVKVVNQRTGEPKSGAQVRVTLDVQSGTGGHDHDDGQRPKGTLAGCAQVSNGVYDCTTGGNGEAGFDFQATPVSGTHTISAVCVSPACTNNPRAGSVDVKVAGLVPIPDSVFFKKISPNADTNHPNANYLAPEAVERLRDIALRYLIMGLVDFGNVLSPLYVNDASLKWGGVLDCFSTCPDSVPWGPYHIEHRRGTVVDIRANGAEGSIPINKKMTRQFSALAKRTVLGQYPNGAGDVPIAKIHGKGNGRHFHVQLLGRKE